MYLKDVPFITAVRGLQRYSIVVIIRGAIRISLSSLTSFKETKFLTIWMNGKLGGCDTCHNTLHKGVGEYVILKHLFIKLPVHKIKGVVLIYLHQTMKGALLPTVTP